jgi:hypothetical protein
MWFPAYLHVHQARFSFQRNVDRMWLLPHRDAAGDGTLPAGTRTVHRHAYACLDGICEERYQTMRTAGRLAANQQPTGHVPLVRANRASVPWDVDWICSVTVIQFLSISHITVEFSHAGSPRSPCQGMYIETSV